MAGRTDRDHGVAGAAAAGTEPRTALTTTMTGLELQRWYYLRSELAGLARQLGVSAAGSKAELTGRLVAALDGQPLPAAAPRPAATAEQLGGALSLDTVIPVGQRCSQTLRSFFVDRIGAQFRFDGHMRSFIGQHPGSTLRDAVEHWYGTRSTEPQDIGGQFELNRFTRQYYSDHPDGSRQELLAAWTRYRATPTDRRSRA